MVKFDDAICMLETIKQKPGLYIGSKSLKKLKGFMDGYIYAMNQNGMECHVDQYWNFNEWISKRYNIRSTESWDSFLLKVEKNEERAFDLFYEQLDLFLNELIKA